MRSGMRSWSKCVIFSRRMKSSSSVGPRRPAFSEFWLSATGTPWLVVSTWPLASTRTRSSGSIVGVRARGGAPRADLVGRVRLGQRAAGDERRRRLGGLALGRATRRCRARSRAACCALNGNGRGERLRAGGLGARAGRRRRRRTGATGRRPCCGRRPWRPRPSCLHCRRQRAGASNRSSSCSVLSFFHAGRRPAPCRGCDAKAIDDPGQFKCHSHLLASIAFQRHVPARLGLTRRRSRAYTRRHHQAEVRAWIEALFRCRSFLRWRPRSLSPSTPCPTRAPRPSRRARR